MANILHIKQEDPKKAGRAKKIFAVVGVVVLLAAVIGLGATIRWVQMQNQAAEQNLTPSLPAAVSDLEKLRDAGDTAAFDQQLQKTLSDPSIDDNTRYLVYIEQGHNAMQNQKWQAAVDAYNKAWEVKEDKQVAGLLGDAYAALGDKTKAIDFYRKAISLIPEGYPNQGLKREYEASIKALEEGAQP